MVGRAEEAGEEGASGAFGMSLTLRLSDWGVVCRESAVGGVCWDCAVSGFLWRKECRVCGGVVGLVGRFFIVVVCGIGLYTFIYISFLILGGFFEFDSATKVFLLSF